MNINTLNKRDKSKVKISISNFSDNKETALKQQKTITDICQSLYNVYKYVSYDSIMYYLNLTDLKISESKY
jgi:hypothetical protein